MFAGTRDADDSDDSDDSDLQWLAISDQPWKLDAAMLDQAMADTSDTSSDEDDPTVKFTAGDATLVASFGIGMDDEYEGGISDDIGDAFTAGLAENEDDDEDAPTESEPDRGVVDERLVSVVEQCLFWGGEQRLRVQVTLSTAGALRGSRART